MITWIYEDNSSAEASVSTISRSDVTGYCIAEDVSVLPTENVPNAAKIYVMDWKALDESAKSDIGSQILMFDEKNKRWLPQ